MGTLIFVSIIGFFVLCCLGMVENKPKKQPVKIKVTEINPDRFDLDAMIEEDRQKKIKEWFGI